MIPVRRSTVVAGIPPRGSKPGFEASELVLQRRR
jgi:hypothetical protein